jgi:hypothetical protein
MLWSSYNPLYYDDKHFLIILMWSFFILGNNDNEIWSIQAAVIQKKKSTY